MAGHLATAAQTWAGLLRSGSWRRSLALAAIAGLGLACRTCGGAFLADWWALVLLLWLGGWLGLAALLSRRGGTLEIQARRLAVATAPFALWLGLLVMLPAVRLRALLDAWALGGCGTLIATAWFLPSLGKPPAALERLVRWPGTVWVLAGAWGAVYFAATALQWWRFGQFSQDMAIYEQAMYNTLHGHFLAYSIDIRYPRTELHRFADHFEPIIVGFVPLYALWQTPLWFLLAQALVPATGAVPVARMATEWCRSPWAGLTMAGLYLLFPGLHLALWHDFHPIVLAGAFVLWGLHWGLRRRAGLCVLSLVLALACKESVPGTVVVVGLYLAWRGQKHLGLSIACGAVVWGLVAVLAVPRWFSPTGATFYSHLLDGPTDVLASAGGLWAYAGTRLDYLASVLGSVGGVCVLAPVELALAGPELALALLSNNRWMHSLQAHYHVLLSVGVLLGAARALAWLRAQAPGPAGRILGVTPSTARQAAVLLVVLTSLVMLRGEKQILTTFSWSWFAGRSPEQKQLARLLAQIPDGASVLTNDGGLASHLARRRWLIFHYSPGRASDPVLVGADSVDYVALSVDPGQSDAGRVSRCYPLQLVGQAGHYYVWKRQSPARRPSPMAPTPPARP